MPIPARLIQTHRSPELAQASRDSWLAHNPGFEYVFYDDAACRSLFETRCPDLLATYDRLPLPVQKADLFRYAAVYLDGGVYADTDTRCCASLDSYADCQQDMLLAGLEMSPDQYAAGMADYSPTYAVPHQLAQWTFAASPQHPALAVLLHRIAWYVSRMTNAQLAGWSQAMRFTLEITGPHVFTQVCNEFLCGSRSGRITVLPRMAWGSWLFEHSLPELRDQIKVKHLYEGSWKSSPAASAAALLRYQFKLPAGN